MFLLMYYHLKVRLMFSLPQSELFISTQPVLTANFTHIWTPGQEHLASFFKTLDASLVSCFNVQGSLMDSYRQPVLTPSVSSVT